MPATNLAYQQPYQPDPRSFESVLLKAHLPPEHAANFAGIRLPFELMPHQQENIHCGLSWTRFGLFDQPRTGKTIVMQLLAIFFRHYGLRTIVLMPPILFDQFEAEFNKIGGHGMVAKTLTGSAQAKEKLLQDWAFGTKTPPDVLMLTREMFSGPFGKKNEDRAKYVNYLKKCYTILMWDECHLGLQNEDSQAFKTVEGFCESVPNSRLILSTGTPSTTELRSAYPTIRLKNPEAYRSRRHFDAQHVIFREFMVRSAVTPMNPSGLRRVTGVSGYTEHDRLHQNLFFQSRRTTRTEAFGMEQPNVQEVPIRLDPAHLKFYRAVVRDKLIEIGTEIIDLRVEQLLRQFSLRIITSPEYGGNHEIKNNNVITGLKTLFDMSSITDNKVLVFANFNHSVEFLAKRFGEYHPATIYGPNGSDKNRAEIAKFKESPACRLAIVNPQAGGVGYTLGDVCQTVIFAEPVSSPAIFEQAASRVILKGQTEPVAIYILKVLETSSPKAIERMLLKSGEINEVMRDQKTLLDELLPK